MARPEKNSAWNEVVALTLLGSGTLLFLALISYSPRDLPGWIWFSHISPPNPRVQNFIGLVGATGLATGPHVHFQIDVDGRPVDPAAWLAS